jgi:hypothetical protein
MADIFNFFKSFELWIYGLLALAGLFYIVRFFRGWDEMRQAAFGLEHEAAHQKLSKAATGLVFMVLLAVSEFILVNFIIPIIPESTPLPTPTLNIIVTPTLTLAPQPSEASGQAVGASNAQAIPGMEVPEGGTPGASGCIPEKIAITEPINGGSVSGITQIKGSANIPGFGFYKFEFSSPGQTTWTAVQAWTEPKTNDMLGQWDTARLTEGLYLLRLVVTDNQGKAAPPCVIQITVLKPPQ